MTTLEILKQRVDEACRELKNARNNYNRHTLKMTGAQWVEQIEKIDDETIREQVACLIWWDYPDKAEIKSLMKEYDAKVKRNITALKKGLMTAGYTAERARRRLKGSALNNCT